MAKSVVLKGNKVVLRPLSVKDAARFCRWLKDREVTKFLSIYDLAPPSLKEEREWIKKKSKSDVRFAIDTIDGQHIGSISLRLRGRSGKVAEYGIFIGDKKYHGQGLGTEAGRLIIDYGFRKLKLHRIFLRFIAYNFRGKRSYEKLGFSQEGIQRQHVFRNGHWHDQYLMGILAEEYLKKGIRK